MDWQAFEDGMSDWVAKHAHIERADVVWDNQPLGMLGRAFCVLSQLGNASGSSFGLERFPDEVRYHPPATPDADATVQIVGLREFTLQIRVVTRDWSARGKALRYLERLQDAIYLPSSQALFAELCVVVASRGNLIDLSRTFDHRVESMGTLDLHMLYPFDTLCECGADTMTPETIASIEHVRVAGTVYTPPLPPIQVPERQIDK